MAHDPNEFFAQLKTFRSSQLKELIEVKIPEIGRSMYFVPESTGEQASYFREDGNVYEMTLDMIVIRARDEHGSLLFSKNQYGNAKRHLQKLPAASVARIAKEIQEAFPEPTEEEAMGNSEETHS